MPRLKIDYSKIIIYKLIHKDDYENRNVYVGSTIDFTKRKSSHKKRCLDEKSKEYNLKVYKVIRENEGWENWRMIEIEKYPCNDKREAEAREQYWLEHFNAELNTHKAFTTKEQKKEYIKQYCLENAEEIKEKSKQYRLDNPQYIKQYHLDNAEEIKEKSKQYRLENAEAIKKYKKQKIECECNGKYRIDGKARHFKSLKHQKYIKNQV